MDAPQLLARLMTLLSLLRRPQQKPPYIEDLDHRQDDVEHRLEKVMSVEGANRAQRVIHASGRR